MTDLSALSKEVISRLRRDFSGVKLLALGQTVYWDEPMKAVLRRALDEHYPEAVMAVGIHDADYFSRIPANLPVPEGWTLLPHNDGSTRDLWVATGEISRLFGSETVPARDMLTGHGAQMDKIARDFPGGRDSLIDTATEAWGWRGLIHRDSVDEVSCCIPLRDALPHLLQLLDWGFSHTIDSLAEPASAGFARRQADHLLSEVKNYAETHPQASITDLFRDLLPHFYGQLLGYQPANLELTSITEVFRFNRSTAELPRFDLLRAFLDPSTRASCQEAYDLSLEDSDIHTLDRFCDGAIPFDLVVPGRGRGTICITDGRIMIDTDEPIVIEVDPIPSTPEELAGLVEEQFGAGIALVGKALTLVLMMASEFIFVLNEQGSSYVPYCKKMAGLLKDRGIDLPFYPILRISYHTWDALSECDGTFSLPGWLATAFRQGEITSKEFSDSWQSAIREQEDLLERLSGIQVTEELLSLLADQHADPWRERLRAYKEASAAVRELSERTEPLKAESVQLRDLSHQIKAEVQALELQKGEHFRTEVKLRKDSLDQLEFDGKGSSPEADCLRQGLAEHSRLRAEMEAGIEKRREEAQSARNRSLEIKETVLHLEKSDEARQARELLKSIEYESELARLWLVRDALLVSKGLPYTDHRPSAWWFLLVDPELKWFNKVAKTAEFRFEEIST